MIKYIVCQLYYCKIDFKVKYFWEKDVFNEMTCKTSLISNLMYGRRHSKLFETVMFRGTPCTFPDINVR